MATLPKQYIPKGSDPVLEKFINCLMNKGKKALARQIFADAMDIIKTRTKDAPMDVFAKALLNTTPLVEVRPKRIAGAVYQVPTEVPAKRQQSLSVRWILTAARARKGVPIAEKLALELLDAAQEQGSAVKKKEDVYKMAQANKAYAHFAKMG
ncbi:MAG: 30S ribosomal protein S7 [Candidatus Peribacteraceae bacterium]|nr:30S ribosomal protein S7 [Candidatus Peribacteraceae bacterium]